MSFLKRFKTKSKFEKFLFLAVITSVIILIYSCVKYIYYGSVNWDEPYDLIGIDEHLNFAKKVLIGEKADYKDIFINLEWYGIGLKSIYAMPNIILRNWFNQEDNRELLFITLRGFSLLIYIFSGIIFYYTSNFYQKRKSKIFALIFFTFPLLAGESYLNIKDIPFALCFTFYSLFNGIFVLLANNKLENNFIKKKNLGQLNKFIFWRNQKIIFILATFMAALLINNKASMIVPVFIIETVLAFYLFEKKG